MLFASRTAKKLVDVVLDERTKLIKDKNRLVGENYRLHQELEKAQAHNRTLENQNCDLWHQVRELERKVKNYESSNSRT